MDLRLIGGELLINIFFEKSDREYDDNVCINFQEPCNEDTKLFRAKETNLFITPKEARQLAGLLLKAAEASDLSSYDSSSPLDPQ